MSKKQSSKPKAAQAAKTEPTPATAPEAPVKTPEATTAPAVVDAKPEAEKQSAPAKKTAPAKAAAEKPQKKARIFRVRHGSLIVGQGHVLAMGEKLIESALPAEQRDRFLADGTLEEVSS